MKKPARLALALLLAALAACKTAPTRESRITDAASGWLKAAERAGRSKTFGRGDYRDAVVDMGSYEADLRDACRTDAGKALVREALDAALARGRAAAKPGDEEALALRAQALDSLAKALDLP